MDRLELMVGVEESRAVGDGIAFTYMSNEGTAVKY